MTKEQFAQLVLDSTDSLYRVSKGILKNDSDCEDAVWEAIGIGFARLNTLQRDEFAKTWLIRILIHETYRVLKERKRQAGLTEEAMEYGTVYGQNGYGVHSYSGGSGAALEQRKEKYSDLYEALGALEDKYRVPLILFYLEGYSIREIADILQSTEGTVKSWLSRGRGYLKRILEER